MPPILILHGALGSWDEIIFFMIGAVFLVVMGISWFRSRLNTTLPDEPPAADSAAAHPQRAAHDDHIALE